MHRAEDSGRGSDRGPVRVARRGAGRLRPIAGRPRDPRQIGQRGRPSIPDALICREALPARAREAVLRPRDGAYPRTGSGSRNGAGEPWGGRPGHPRGVRREREKRVDGASLSPDPSVPPGSAGVADPDRRPSLRLLTGRLQPRSSWQGVYRSGTDLRRRLVNLDVKTGSGGGPRGEFSAPPGHCQRRLTVCDPRWERSFTPPRSPGARGGRSGSADGGD